MRVSPSYRSYAGRREKFRSSALHSLGADHLSAPKLAGCATDFASEKLYEVGRILESELLTDHGNRQDGMREESFCLEIDSRRNKVLGVDSSPLHRSARQALLRTSEPGGVLSHTMPLRKSLIHETPEDLEAPQSHEVCIPRCLLGLCRTVRRNSSAYI